MSEVRNELCCVEKELGIDPLTGARNRRYLKENAETLFFHSVTVNHPLCALYFDLDSFKLVNDKIGHTKGDKILVDFVDLLKNTTRSSEADRPGDQVYRVGGDEFLVLMPEMLEKDLDSFLERLRREVYRLGERHNIPKDFQFGVSVGQVFKKDEENFETMLKRVDGMMRDDKSTKDRRR